ncbi:hypothetical protein CKAN_02647600 [Cinnamomum micranthum f. kanehirae]|uniref:Uncharacterized protein n=1 Tax=Cinnamomum micranthum f. kanehirae TaxID=337451 RepID=A0A3S4Q080_9MAGN|nr:hypothetical protein CKAN_02647600 [Cinnamomum micranthum f. kanehirae]
MSREEGEKHCRRNKGRGEWRLTVNGDFVISPEDNPETPLQIFSASHHSPHQSLISAKKIMAFKTGFGFFWVG